MASRPIPQNAAETAEMQRTRTYRGQSLCGCGNYAEGGSHRCSICAASCEVCGSARATTKRHGDAMCGPCAREHG